MTTTQRGRVSVDGRRYKFDGDFHIIYPGTPIMKGGDKLCGVTTPRDMTYVHSYGGEAPFFQGLAEGKLYATKCDNPDCENKGTMYLPFRIHCPDCFGKNSIVDVTELANKEARVYTYIVTNRTGAFNTLPKPIRFIDIEFPGIATFLKGYMSGTGDPEIGMHVVPIFKTKDPSYTILDISWVPEGTAEADLPEGFTFSK